VCVAVTTQMKLSIDDSVCCPARRHIDRKKHETKQRVTRTVCVHSSRRRATHFKVDSSDVDVTRSIRTRSTARKGAALRPFVRSTLLWSTLRRAQRCALAKPVSQLLGPANGPTADSDTGLPCVRGLLLLSEDWMLPMKQLSRRHEPFAEIIFLRTNKIHAGDSRETLFLRTAGAHQPFARV
jgi:hypothetical protein